MSRIFNWRPSLKHPNRPMFAARPLLGVELPLPMKADLRGGMPPVYDQLNIGSCTANALAATFAFEVYRQTGAQAISPSRLFIYWNERNIEGTTTNDAGACLCDGIKVLSTLGVCDESVWPYDINQFTARPSDAAFALALKHEALQFQSIMSGDIYAICKAISDGAPVVCGITIFESFEYEETAKTGVVPMPDEFNEKILGGHAIVIVAYDSDREFFTCRNSWGDQWGQKGYFDIPYEYIRTAASDLWTIQKVTV